ncbi:hypothetical protein RND81_07G148600 [Saponaria officinalis]|uniref:non-specific serine/threonine protein kinase n=1 Tax=Saponaria officinalis TaxID=3572 RepID=A0AAW1JQH3_SAPOF
MLTTTNHHTTTTMHRTFLLFLLICHLPLPSHSLSQDGLYLLHLTQTLSDPTRFFSGWSDRSDTPCNWKGVSCSGSTPGSVTSLDLSGSSLAGPFPLILCRLRSLTSLVLYDNNLNSSLPSEISTCSNLVHLDLAQNLFVGEIPANLAEISSLKYLDLSGNNFSGEVPASFGTFRNLEVVSLTSNLLDGKFPNFFSNVSTLRQLNLSYNSFQPSQLGDELGSMAKLEVFWAANCNLIGEIPSSISGMKSLLNFDVSTNELTGNIPSSLTELTSLVQAEFYSNSFSGELPKKGWSKMKSLRYFDASMNQLTGTIPTELTQLELASFNLYENKLEGSIPENVADSRNLYELKLFSNRFTGELPRKLGENAPVNLIDVSNNLLTGSLPPNLCAKGKLSQLLMINNSFSGEIPTSLEKCATLTRVRLNNNNFSGEVPANFWGLPRVTLLELSDNSLSGEIAKSIASASNISQLLISNNDFSGEIPFEIGVLGKLVSFVASDNKFSGPLPQSIVRLEELGVLDLHNNQFSGEIPSGIKKLTKLNDLNLANNQFSGLIPDEIGDLPLNYLDLSNNQFSGQIPNELENLKLNQFNLSNNRLSGALPPLFANEIYRSSFVGNPGLCGDLAGLCDSKIEVKKQGYFWVLRAIFIITALVLVVGLIWFYRKYKSFKQAKRSIDRSKWTLMSFHKLGFSEYEILDCLDEDNVIGTGASGKVYKAVLSNGETVAVKKLWGSSKKVGDGGDIEKGVGQDDGFEAEVDTLGKIRHKNIVRLWCCCKTKDCELLVYEYMINGSLGDLLHGPKGGLLDWPTRFRVALDAAEGLSYLHHDCVPPIVHRDIKSNNILLDGDFGAKVADFGVAKVVDSIGKGTKSMSVIAGSCGYIAPEYAYTLRVNEKSDTYSFGVVILELVTGKRPVDPEYGEKDLVKWVCTTMDQKGVDHVLDPRLDSCFKEEICKVLNIGLLCTSPLPINRPSMRRVVKMLLEVSGENHSKSGVKDGKLTPYYYEDGSDHGSVVA